jgi:hypothetical protein
MEVYSTCSILLPVFCFQSSASNLLLPWKIGSRRLEARTRGDRTNKALDSIESSRFHKRDEEERRSRSIKHRETL